MIFISSWIMSILGVVVLGSVVDLLLAKSRMKNFIRTIFATVAILIIITPLPSILGSGFDISWSDMVDNIKFDESFLAYSNGQKLSAMEKAVEAALEEEGIAGAKIKVTGEVTGNEINVRLVYIDLSNSVIKENLANINKYEFIKERVRSFVGNEVEVVING